MVNVAGLKKCLASVKTRYDYDILIVNNWDDDAMIEYLGELEQQPNVDVLYHPNNPGVAFAWNRGLERMAAGQYQYCIMPNDDVVFGVGSIDTLIEAADADRELCIVFSNFGWPCFLITPRSLELVGTFDENCVGAYLEDVDYIHRLTLLKGKYTTIYHNGVDHAQDSTTIKSSPVLRELNNLTHAFNFGYMLKKWGLTQERVREVPKSPHPYGDPGLTPRDWKRFDLDIQGIITRRQRMREQIENRKI